MPETTFAEEAELQRLIAAHRDQPGALLPILHAVQETFGYVDDAAVPIIAKALNLSRAEVHGVLTFYHDFRREPAGRHVLRLCQAEACQSMGCEKLAEGCGPAWASTSATPRPTGA
jgi:NADH:ubiquinone oxidoreductase 24 kD subunit